MQAMFLSNLGEGTAEICGEGEQIGIIYILYIHTVFIHIFADAYDCTFILMHMNMYHHTHL